MSNSYPEPMQAQDALWKALAAKHACIVKWFQLVTMKSAVKMEDVRCHMLSVQHASTLEKIAA